MPPFSGVQHILLDIAKEGTICPISFVKETLFPYAIKALPDVLATKWDDEAFRPFRDAFPDEHRQSPHALQAHAEDLTKRDAKVAYLKDLQGYLWQDGYEQGAYSTTLFDDVLPRLRRWGQDGLGLAIYSSGSVFAQKLLFGHVRTSAIGADTEDLTGLVAAWFDTTNAGPKTLAESYTKIAHAQKWRPGHVLFLSDNVKEVRAAKDAGMQSVVVDRPGNAPLSDEDRGEHTIVQSFDAIEIE